ncbi:unnamed protein product [Urochloa decumbens]|uniref:Auxin efflux carrier component n=1 Tax=Urochloa decumbens TaxID=240449 RepID=A0ABC9AQN8_9POAL
MMLMFSASAAAHVSAIEDRVFEVCATISKKLKHIGQIHTHAIIIMIPGSAVYHVVEAMAPLYTAAALGYASVRWRIGAFSDEQCAGINRFVALYSMPALIFRMVATSDPYAMNGRFVAADTLQKAAILLALYAWALFASRLRGSKKAASPVKWAVTGFSAATMTSNIIMGVPLLAGMYGGEASRGLVEQLVVMQVCVWYNVVLFAYEYIAAMDGSGGAAEVSPEPPVPVVAETTENSMEVVVAETTEISAGAAKAVEVQAGESLPAAPAAEPPKPSSVTMRHVVWTAGKKVLKIPNTYASFLGLAWSLIAFKFGIKMPKIVDDSLLAISTTAVGLSMFASGAFIARQQRFVPCGYGEASLSMVLKFLVGPIVMLLVSIAVGLRGTILRIAVVQAALPLAVSSFVYAEEYKVHADIMSTGVILGTFISLPVTIVYFVLLGL